MYFKRKEFELRDLIMLQEHFKPLPVVLDLVYKNFSNCKNLILFMGKSGKKTLHEALRVWDFEI